MITAVVLSNRLFPLLAHFVSEGRAYYMKIEVAQTFDQRPFRSALIRKYLAFRPGKGFYLTEDGYDAWERFGHTDIHRINPTMPLTRYFDPVAYGLRPDEKKKLPAMKAKGAA
jgi:hypothetical protein